MARLERIGAEEFDRHFAHATRRWRLFVTQSKGGIIADQGGKTATEPAWAFVCHHIHPRFNPSASCRKYDPSSRWLLSAIPGHLFDTQLKVEPEVRPYSN